MAPAALMESRERVRETSTTQNAFRFKNKKHPFSLYNHFKVEFQASLMQLYWLFSSTKTAYYKFTAHCELLALCIRTCSKSDTDYLISWLKSHLFSTA